MCDGCERVRALSLSQRREVGTPLPMHMLREVKNPRLLLRMSFMFYLKTSTANARCIDHVNGSYTCDCSCASAYGGLRGVGPPFGAAV